MRTRNLVSIPRRELSLLALLPLLFPSCSVFFVSPYDEMTDRAATELVTKTEIFIVRMPRQPMRQDTLQGAENRMTSKREAPRRRCCCALNKKTKTKKKFRYSEI